MANTVPWRGKLTEGFSAEELEVVFRFLNTLVERYADADDEA